MRIYNKSILEIDKDGVLFPIKNLPLEKVNLGMPVFSSDFNERIVNYPPMRIKQSTNRIEELEKYYDGDISYHINTNNAVRWLSMAVDRYEETLLSSFPEGLEIEPLCDIIRQCLVYGTAFAINEGGELIVPDWKWMRPLDTESWIAITPLVNMESSSGEVNRIQVDEFHYGEKDVQLCSTSIYEGHQNGTNVSISTDKVIDSYTYPCEFVQINHGNVINGVGSSLVEFLLPIVVEMVQLRQIMTFTEARNTSPVMSFKGSKADFNSWADRNNTYVKNDDDMDDSDLANVAKARYNNIMISEGSQSISWHEYSGSILSHLHDDIKRLNQEFTMYTGIPLVENTVPSAESNTSMSQGRQAVPFRQKAKKLHFEITQKLESIGFTFTWPFVDEMENVSNTSGGSDVSNSGNSQTSGESGNQETAS